MGKILKIKIYQYKTDEEKEMIWATISESIETGLFKPDEKVALEPNGTIHVLKKFDQFGMSEIKIYPEGIREEIEEIKRHLD